MRVGRLVVAGALGVGMFSAGAQAGEFARNHLVVMLVSSDHPGGSGALRFDELTLSGAPVGNSILLPSAGTDAVCKSDLVNHDRHLHLSVDGQYLAFVAYGRAPSAADPAGESPVDSPRVVGLIKPSGNVDLSTRLTDTCEFTSIRSATTTNGTALWIAGDNASGATLTGGLRYCTRGASGSVNLSQVQAFGGARTPDNIRDVGIFAGQLYDSSGSNASVGKGMFSVGAGLPTTGAPVVSAINTDGSSVSGFALLDMLPGVAGPDVVYCASSSGGGVRKYVKQASGTWMSRGFVLFTDASDLLALRQTDGSVRVIVGGAGSIVSFVDPAPTTADIDGSLTLETVFTPPAGYTLGGFDLSPACAADFNGGGLTVQDIFDFLNAWFAGNARADFNHSGGLEIQDIFDFLNAWFGGCP